MPEGGRILIIGSVNGDRMPVAGMAAYAFASAITLRKVGFFGGLGLLVVCFRRLRAR
jgi:hypothetical protein